MAHDVFISYSSKDKHIADAVCSALETKKVPCWYAPRDISGGTNWPAAIMKAIGESRVMVYVLTGNSKMSIDVTREVQHAFRKGITVIPFRLENITATDDLEYYLEHVHWLDAFPPPFESYLTALVTHVKNNLQQDSTLNVDEEVKKAEKMVRKRHDEQLLESAEQLFVQHRELVEARKEFDSEEQTALSQVRDKYRGESRKDMQHRAEAVSKDLLSRSVSIPETARIVNAYLSRQWILILVLLLGVFIISGGLVAIGLDDRMWPLFVAPIVFFGGLKLLLRLKDRRQRFFNFADPTTAAEQLRLAKLYSWGRDYPSAFRWYLKAAEKGDATAIFVVASWYEQGIGLSQDLEEADRWRSTAVRLGVAEPRGQPYRRG